MRLIRAGKLHKYRNGCDILTGAQYYPLRRNKALCFNCGYKRQQPKTIIEKLTGWVYGNKSRKEAL